MGGKKVDHESFVGHTFGLWTVVRIEPFVSKQRRRYWCRCACGKEKSLPGSQVTATHMLGCKSCATERLRPLVTIHGAASRDSPDYPIYKVWAAMIRRCEVPRDTSYQNYGARGIRVCDRWRKSYADFIADMGQRPSARHSLERINNLGNYEPGNVRWATQVEQGRNKRNNRYVMLHGERVCTSRAAELLGITKQEMWRRLKCGTAVKYGVTQ